MKRPSADPTVDSRRVVVDVAAWQRQLGLERFEPVFRAHEIDCDVLPELTDSDLEKLGLPLGPRKKLLKAIAELATEQAGPADPATPSPRPMVHEAERRQLTVMFRDLVIRRYEDAVSGAVARYGGHVAKFLGDGVLCYFGWPLAYEDQAERASAPDSRPSPRSRGS